MANEKDKSTEPDYKAQFEASKKEHDALTKKYDALAKKNEALEADKTASDEKYKNLEAKHSEEIKDLKAKHDEAVEKHQEELSSGDFETYKAAIIENRQASQEFGRKRDDAKLLVKQFISDIEEALK